eukprot:2769352-Pyramimonas_sp.AAC.1
MPRVPKCSEVPLEPERRHNPWPEPSTVCRGRWGDAFSESPGPPRAVKTDKTVGGVISADRTGYHPRGSGSPTQR